uniref:Huntingtin n=1 Tax=Anopheles epiroticus TaxID=199890 RepID=A0A182PKS6_9DIPT
MDKLNPFGALQRAIESLKTVECSAKEKVSHFGVISETLISVRPGTSAGSSPAYQNHISNALIVLIMFCEETDSSVRMAAEESLSRIVRHCEVVGNIVRIQRDLYHEIKRNGNERSLRIVLSLFAHYCGTIRQRKARTYAQNLLPCIYAIFKRREPALLESLCSFTEVFCEHLEGYLTDGEVLKMTELFLEDIGSDCATKRRCAARNMLTFVQGSRNPDFYANNAFNRCIEQLLKCGPLQQQPNNTVLGVMGCFRAILPIVLRSCSVEKAIETYDLCLHFLREGTHTVINATLEVLLVILANVQPAVRRVLMSEQCDHRRMLLKRKTLKNTIFKINPSDSLLSSRKSSTDARSDHLLRPGSLPLTSTPTKFSLPIDDRSLASASDIELDSLKSMDLDAAPAALQLESSVAHDAGTTIANTSTATAAPDTLSLKSQKSTDSIGSFINTLLTTSNAAESVSKFFRKSIDKPPVTDDAGEEDRVSMESMASSYMSSNAETIRAELDVTLEIENDQTESTVAADVAATVPAANPIPTPTPSRDTLDVPLSMSMVGAEDLGGEPVKELFIGTIHDQNLLEFTARLICSRFLLAGSRHTLIPDALVRVSVKSLSMQIVAACVRMKPELLSLPLERDTLREEFAVVEILNLEDAINEFSQQASPCEDTSDNAALPPSSQEDPTSDLLEMKEDHFGECTSATYFEYFSPMSLSLDQGLKSKLKSIEENFSIDNNEKLSRDLDAILSQSEPGPGTTASLTGSSGTMRRRELLVVPKVITSIKNEHRATTGGRSLGEDEKALTAMAVANRREPPEDEEQQQLLADVLLFYDSPDPTLRGTVQLIVGNFVRAAIDRCGSYGEFLRTRVSNLVTQSFLSDQKLLHVIVQGLSDEIHTVVNQALSSVELFFNVYFQTLPNSRSMTISKPSSNIPFQSSKRNIFLDDSITNQPAAEMPCYIQIILDRLQLLSHNKYWLVQWKLFDLIVLLDYDCISAHGYQGDWMRDKVLDLLLAGLSDGDHRVRNYAGERLLKFLGKNNLEQGSDVPRHVKQSVIGEFVDEFVLGTFAAPFDRRRKQTTDVDRVTTLDHGAVCQVMYRISNLLLKIGDKNLQSGIIHFLRLFLEKYDLFHYVDLWNEYNLVTVLLSFLLGMNSTVLDLAVHADLLFICSHMIVAVLSSSTTNAVTDGESMNKFIIHLLKLLNIYHHVYTNTVPLVVNRTQKADIFMNTKELQQINCFGYFGADHAYMKLYQQVRCSMESYRISINTESGQKLFDCLRTTIEALWTLLEMKSLSAMTNGVKFVEEVLRYLQTFLTLEPDHCVRCTRYLLRFIFHANYINRTAEVAYFRKAALSPDPSMVASLEFFTRYYDFCRSKSKPITPEIGALVKLFEPLVITCLKMFTKMRPAVQAGILQMLCQLLDFNINYQLLDASNAFVESILKHIETVERSTIDDSEELMRQVVRFLFQLSGLVREKPLTTIPKIINVCDNLLANNVIRRTAIASVQALTHEVFLLRLSRKSVLPKVLLEAAECSTQKEVVLNMLIKFPDELDAYRIVPMIVYSERLHTDEDGAQATNCESDVLAALLQVLGDGKLSLKCNEDYFTVLRLFECFGRNHLLESKIVLRFVEIFYTTIANESWKAVQKIAYGELILRQVFQQTEGSYLLNHVGLYLHKQQTAMESAGEEADRLPEDMVQSAVQSLAKTCVCYLRECLRVLDEMSVVYGGASQENVQFTYDTIERFIGTLSNSTIVDEVNRALAEQIPLELICWRSLPPPVERCLCELLIKRGFDLELLLSLIRNDEYSVRNDRLVTVLIETLLEHRPNESKWTRSEVAALLASETVLLSDHFQPLLLYHITDEEFSKQIVKTILSSVEGKLSGVQCTLLEKAPLTTLPLMCGRLTDLLDAVNIVTSRNAALVLDHKLSALVGLGAAGLKDSAVLTVLSESDFHHLYARFSSDRRRRFPKLFKTLSQLKQYYDGVCTDEQTQPVLPTIDTNTLKDLSIDEAWFVRQVSYHCTDSSYTKPRNIAKMLLEIKSESKLINLLSSASLNVRLLRDIIAVAFESMFHAFRTDCVQFNPHLNYLKVHPMLKVALIVLMRKLNETQQKPQEVVAMRHCAESVICFLDHLKRLEHLCLFYIESKFIDRFVKEHLLKSNFFETLLTFGSVCARALEREPPGNVTHVELYLRCIGTIVHQRYLWNELNQNDRYRTDVEHYIKVIYQFIERSLLDGQHFARRQLPAVFESFLTEQGSAMEVYLKAIIIAEFVSDADGMAKSLKLSGNMSALLESISVPLLKLDRFYPYALTPYELYDCYTTLDALDSGHPKLPAVPIEHLYDVELLEMFLKRANVFGFSSRQQFEELFMSLMVLLNRTEDPIFVSLVEQREIKNMCLRAVMTLLLSCYRYPWIGFREGKFHHTTRNPKIKCDTIGLKKLHNVQLFIPLSNVFYQPNLERRLLITGTDDLYTLDDSSIGTVQFDQNQLSLEYFWELIERTAADNTLPVEALVVRNKRHFVEKINIDSTSCMQLIYDVLKQLIEDDPALVLPHLVRFCELVENREQLYIRNATLHGLICLLECLVKTNSSIGAMNDELQLLRNVTVNYIVKHGIIEESSGAFSDLHTKLVWTLNFYLIEHTSRFVADCNLLSNSIISANNILKRTNNLEIYLCILNGLERLIITDRVSRTLHEKIEKLAIDLVKIDNEMFSLSALKLLVTCIYRSCNEQLESTERCNGIVQDEPDIIVQQIDKIEILFAKIRTTTPLGAKVFGDVLCQLIRDLLPPNEILTKVFKELMLNQPNPDIIAGVTYQLFRSAIDASYLPLLQEWLLCSLPNFLSFPQVNKSVWCLTVIFLSASLNQHLIKLLPEVLSLPSYQQLNEREMNTFIISAKDFYARLDANGSQRTKFKEIFRQHDSFVFQRLVQCL